MTKKVVFTGYIEEEVLSTIERLAATEGVSRNVKVAQLLLTGMAQERPEIQRALVEDAVANVLDRLIPTPVVGNTSEQAKPVQRKTTESEDIAAKVLDGLPTRVQRVVR